MLVKRRLSRRTSNSNHRQLLAPRATRHTPHQARSCSGTSPATLCPGLPAGYTPLTATLCEHWCAQPWPCSTCVCSHPLAHCRFCALPCVIYSTCSRYAPTRGYSICCFSVLNSTAKRKCCGRRKRRLHRCPLRAPPPPPRTHTPPTSARFRRAAPPQPSFLRACYVPLLPRCREPRTATPPQST